MLVILSDDREQALWLIDHLVTNIHGNTSYNETDTPDQKNDHDIKQVGDEQMRHSSLVFGKLLQPARFSHSGSSIGDTADEGESESMQSDNDSHHALEWLEMNRRDWIHLPFELLATDSILYCVNQLLAKDTVELEETSNEYIDQILRQKNIGDDHFKIIRIIKDGRREMSSRVKGFCASMTRTLNEGEFKVMSCFHYQSRKLKYANSLFLHFRRGHGANESFSTSHASRKLCAASVARCTRERI
jgi:hypothetical protein